MASTRMSKSIDPHCYNLADFWLVGYRRAKLAGDAGRISSLARAIQRAVENWCEDQDKADEAAYDAKIDQQIDERRG